MHETLYAWEINQYIKEHFFQAFFPSFLQVLEKSKLLRKKAVYVMTSPAFLFNILIGMHIKYRNATTQMHFWQVPVYSHKKERSENMKDIA